MGAVKHGQQADSAAARSGAHEGHADDNNHESDGGQARA
jgi:hypothetical protein